MPNTKPLAIEDAWIQNERGFQIGVTVYEEGEVFLEYPFPTVDRSDSWVDAQIHDLGTRQHDIAETRNRVLTKIQHVVDHHLRTRG